MFYILYCLAQPSVSTAEDSQELVNLLESSDSSAPSVDNESPAKPIAQQQTSPAVSDASVASQGCFMVLPVFLSVRKTASRKGPLDVDD